MEVRTIMVSMLSVIKSRPEVSNSSPLHPLEKEGMTTPAARATNIKTTINSRRLKPFFNWALLPRVNVRIIAIAAFHPIGA